MQTNDGDNINNQQCGGNLPAAPSSSSIVAPAPASSYPSCSLPPSSSPSALSFTDFWHLESGLVEWRSEWLRQRDVLRQLEAHLLEEQEKGLVRKAKRKLKKKSKKKKQGSESNSSAPSAEGAEPENPISLVSSSSSSSSEEEVDVDDLLTFAHRAAYGPQAAPELNKHSIRKNRSKRGKKRTIRENDEDESKEQTQRDRDTTSIAAASSSSQPIVNDHDLCDGDEDELELDPLESEFMSMGSTMRGILSNFHSTRRKSLSKLRSKRKREEKLLSNGGKRSRVRQDQESDYSFNPVTDTKRRKQVKSHRITAWKDDTAANKHSTAAAAAAAASDSTVNILNPNDMESRLLADPASFLCIGTLTLRQVGSIASEKVIHLTQSATGLSDGESLRAEFSQRLLPSNGQPDPDELPHIYFRLHSASISAAARSRMNAIAAEKRREAKERQRRLEEAELESGLYVLPEEKEEEKKVESKKDPTHDDTIIGSPILWHPSAVLSTHHSHKIHIAHLQPTTDNSSIANSELSTSISSNQAQPSALAAHAQQTISTTVLDAIFYLFSRRHLYIYPIYSPRHHVFKLYLYLMPSSWIHLNTSSTDALASARRVDHELTCQHLTTLLRWSCSIIQPQLNPFYHFNPHAIFDACRPPVLPVSAHTTSNLFEELEDKLHKAGLNPTLRPYQKQALLWLLQRECIPWKAMSSKRFTIQHSNSLDAFLNQSDSDAMDSHMDIDGDEDRHLVVEKDAARQRLHREYMASWDRLALTPIKHPFNSNVANAMPNPIDTIFLNSFTGCVSALHPSKLESCEEIRGGILAG